MAFMNLTEATAVQGLRHHFGPSPTYIRALLPAPYALCVVCSAWCLCLLDAWWCLQSDVGTNSRPQVAWRAGRRQMMIDTTAALGNGVYAITFPLSFTSSNKEGVICEVGCVGGETDEDDSISRSGWLLAWAFPGPGVCRFGCSGKGASCAEACVIGTRCSAGFPPS